MLEFITVTNPSCMLTVYHIKNERSRGKSFLSSLSIAYSLRLAFYFFNLILAQSANQLRLNVKHNF